MRLAFSEGVAFDCAGGIPRATGQLVGSAFLGSTRPTRVRCSVLLCRAGRSGAFAGRSLFFPRAFRLRAAVFTAFRVALTGRVPGAQWTRLHSVDETIFMRGISDYRACRVLFAEHLQDRGAHRARYVTVYKIFENVVITLFYFEQGTDANYYDFLHYFILLQHLDSLY